MDLSWMTLSLIALAGVGLGVLAWWWECRAVGAICEKREAQTNALIDAMRFERERVIAIVEEMRRAPWTSPETAEVLASIQDRTDRAITIRVREDHDRWQRERARVRGTARP